MPAISKRLDKLIGSSFISIASGIGITLSLAPFNYWPLGLLSAGCLFLLMQGKNILQASILGWLFGLGLFGSGASWVYVSIHDFAFTSAQMAVFLTVLFCSCLVGFKLFLTERHLSSITNRHYLKSEKLIENAAHF